MHSTAMKNGKLFFDTYTMGLTSGKVLDIGAQNINGSLKDVCPAHLNYVGVDFVQGNGVDIVLVDPYQLPFEDESTDIIVMSSVLEHSEMFWILFLEIIRVLKPSGLLYMNTPSNGRYHIYPVDCWRFHPDSGKALVTWAKRNGYSPMLLESFISHQDNLIEMWNDLVAVFLKDAEHLSLYQHRMIDVKKDFSNAWLAGLDTVINQRTLPEDQEKLQIINAVIKGEIRAA